MTSTRRARKPVSTAYFSRTSGSFPTEAYGAALKRYPNARDIVWCQEEPENQGAWYQIKHRLQIPLSKNHRMMYATRPGAASTATGYNKVHVIQQNILMQAALKEGSVLVGA